MSRLNGLKIGKCVAAALLIVLGVITLVGSTLFYRLNYGDAIAVTPIVGFPVTLTGKNFKSFHGPAKYIVLQHERLHQHGERDERVCYERQLSLSSYILGKGTFDGSSLSDADIAELEFLKRLAASHLDGGRP